MPSRKKQARDKASAPAPLPDVAVTVTERERDILYKSLCAVNYPGEIVEDVVALKKKFAPRGE